MPVPRHIKIVADDEPTKLLQLTHQQFYNFVDQDVRSRLEDGVSDKLRDPRIVERWYLVLVQMKKNVESQLASAKADWQTELFQILADQENAPSDDAAADLRAEQFEKHSKYAGNRAKKLRFRSAVEDRLAEARFLRNDMMERSATREVRMLRHEIHELRHAIEVHRSVVGGEATDDDSVLWSALDGLRSVGER